MLDIYLNGDTSKQHLRIERSQKSKERKERRREQNIKSNEIVIDEMEEMTVNIEEVKSEIIDGVFKEPI